MRARSDPELAAHSEGGWRAQRAIIMAHAGFGSVLRIEFSSLAFESWAVGHRRRVAAMDDREKMILQGAQNAWPQTISISQYRLRHVADRLTDKDLLEKRQFSGGQLGYQITSKGRDQLLERNRNIHARNVNEAEKVLRQSLCIKPPRTSSVRNAKGPATIIPLARKPLREAQ